MNKIQTLTLKLQRGGLHVDLAEYLLMFVKIEHADLYFLVDDA